MPIRIRLRAPNGQHTLSLDDNAAVSDLLSSISNATELPLFELKWNFPPQPLDPALYGLSTPLRDTDLKLNGAQIIVIGQATGDPSEQKKEEEAKTDSELLSLKRKQVAALKDTPEVPLPSRGGTIVMRVMPDDNSCMFRALGTAVLTGELDSMDELRSLVAQGIQSNPELYNEATLEKSPDEYCKWIMNPNSWGGGIELSILSQHFDIEIASINVQDLRVDRFNEGQTRRVILVYSGIHYDTIAFVPQGVSPLDTENDVKLFDASDNVILEAARQLCGELKKQHYFTDTQKFSIQCNTCGWKGAGEQAATLHHNESGHVDFAEST
ncbi:hypothetical protein IAQ61_010077 [Plenodomus lingam]|uniref:Ubiquitin thioesterase OTU n=1 Tax=Leptosphaeria maculans (strain JN3 / isolate v23.1.3 / race Av1-4-5-6-7-8) TaxID=985895 RepID=E5A3U8_LEPMJ|nr:similar to ubiquitin thioesterase OTU1 [Plenodomus lingam JN3]KAH9861876.1 hypothetical protein IAQ61_010077 [Plenodomus lingam]CBX97972.1 similar to ubiquitin thioesterase OTU1 [Plenodomus lingam JN3]